MKKSLAEKHIYWQDFTVSRKDRINLKGHNPAVIWLTGLSGAGKTTLSKEIEKGLHEMGVHTYLLDGDNIRHGLNRDLGFSKEDRKENIRRIAEVAKLFADAGLVVICAFITPYEEDRMQIRKIISESELINVFVKCPIDVCIKRDPKGLYKKALKGEIKGFTGIDDPYEEPVQAEIVVETDRKSIQECAHIVLSYLRNNGLFRHG